MAKTAKSGKTIDPKVVAAQVEGFIDKFEPAMAAQIRAIRKALRKRFPTAIELVYDNYNFFVIGYCARERSSDCIVSLAANSKGVGLSFYYGADIDDPYGILQGSGTQNRFLRLKGPETLSDPQVCDLIDRAVANAGTPPPEEKGYTVVRSISEKQRPRR
ncbi:MAG TPA: hypothetical protein VGN16_23020 [Acidobacteriaceae bacterium]|jgi:hypothetical protein